MATVTVIRGGEVRRIHGERGESLLSALQRAGLREPDAPCGGNGTCGKCLVEAEGALSEPGAHELEKRGAGERRRLACSAKILGDCTVRLPVSGSDAVIASEGFDGADFPLKPCVPLPSGGGVGAAVDIGTTTVVAYLYDLKDGRRLGVASGMNAQRVFGADVISRVNHANTAPGGLEQMTGAVREQLSGMLRQLCAGAGRTLEEVRDISVAGNTIMEHIFAGLSPASIAVAPFRPLSLFGDSRPAAEVGLPAPNAQVYLAPCVAGYVGGDITAGLLSSGAYRAERRVLFLDIGTNGEMALGDRNGFTCCATAAGPAFEGAEIVCGMSGVTGAISQVRLEKGALRCTVIGGGQAKGICGSGLVDALAVLLKLGAVDETGRLLPPEEAPQEARPWLEETEEEGCVFWLDRTAGVRITEGDVRKLQLAKAAVAAGIQTLLEAAGTDAEGVSAMYLAGGFGSYLDKKSAAAIGLFPARLLPVLRSVGNSAGAGAAEALLSAPAREELTAVRDRCGYLELSSHPAFTGHYIDCMSFEEQE